MILDILAGVTLALSGMVAAYFGVYWLMMICFTGTMLVALWMDYVDRRD